MAYVDRNQILSKIEDLQIHFTRRMDEIRSMLQSSKENVHENVNVIAKEIAKEIETPVIFPTKKPLSNDYLPLNGGDISSRLSNGGGGSDLLLDLAPSAAPQSRPGSACNGIVPPTCDPVTLSADYVPSDTLKYIEVEYGKFLDVYMSFVYSSRSFFVHVNYEEVEQFYMKLNEHYSNAVKENDVALRTSSIVVKQLVCAYSCDDNGYYRAQVLKEAEEKYLVRFVDFGDMKLIEPKFIYKLYPEYAKVPVLSLHCYLDDLWTSNCEKIDSAFMDFLNLPTPYCNAIQIKFQASKDGNKFPVNVNMKSADGKWKSVGEANLESVQIAESISKQTFNFKEFSKGHLSSDNFAKSADAYKQFVFHLNNKLALGSNYSGFCTNCTDISSFIFTQKEVIELTTNMSFFYRGFLENLPKEHIITDKSLVAYSFLNKFYFRGFVLETKPNIEIFAIDFGFVVTAKNEDVFPLVAEFSLSNFQCQSAICGLHKIVPMLDAWSPVAIKTFQTFVLGNFTILTRTYTNGIHTVELEMANKNRASDMLKKFKLGKDDN